MKTTFLYSSLAACAMAFAMTSCGSDEDPIVFPDNQGNVSGEISSEKKTLSFEAQASWQLTVENGVWLKFIDSDGNEQSSISGVEGVQTVSYVITDADWGFTDDVATINITMDETTQPLATVTRKANVRTVKFYQQNEEDSSLKDEVSEISLVWSDNGLSYMTNLFIETNFDWNMEIPGWIANNDDHALATTGEAGLSDKMWLFANYDNYSLDDMSDKIVITDKNDNTARFELTVKAAGSRNMMILNKAINNGLKFNQDGKFVSVDLNQNETLMYSFTLSVKGSSEGFKIVPIWYDNGWYGVMDNNTYQTVYDATWIKIGEPKVTGTGAVRDYEFSISAETATASRNAMLVVVPKSLITADLLTADMVNTNGDELVDKFKPYNVALASQTVDGLAFQYPEYAGQYGATLVSQTSTELGAQMAAKYGCASKLVSLLTYNNASASGMAAILYNYQDGSDQIVISDEDKTWLAMEGGYQNVLVTMDAESYTKPRQGVIVMKNGEGVIQFVLVCKQDFTE